MTKGIKGLDNGVIGAPGESVDPSKDSGYGICFPSLLAKGENPNGFSSVLPTGSTGHVAREGKNKNYVYGETVSGPRWSSNEMWSGNKSGE